MIRTHVSAKPIARLYAVPAAVEGGAYKPNGFWYEVDGDWQRWCSSEEMDWIKGRLLYEVSLDSMLRLLRITSASELDSFHREYRRPRYVGIAWEQVAEQYDGLEIAPYLWDRRLDGPSWYYGWDCASGVLWQPRDTRLSLLTERIEIVETLT